MKTSTPDPDCSDCTVSAARLNAIADRTAANYPSLAAELRRIARGIGDNAEQHPRQPSQEMIADRQEVGA